MPALQATDREVRGLGGCLRVSLEDDRPALNGRRSPPARRRRRRRQTRKVRSGLVVPRRGLQAPWGGSGGGPARHPRRSSPVVFRPELPRRAKHPAASAPVLPPTAPFCGSASRPGYLANRLIPGGVAGVARATRRSIAALATIGRRAGVRCRCDGQPGLNAAALTLTSPPAAQVCWSNGRARTLGLRMCRPARSSTGQVRRTRPRFSRPDVERRQCPPRPSTRP